MSPRPTTTNTAAAIQALKTFRAVLACLACSLLLGAARADDAAQAVTERPPLVASTDQGLGDVRSSSAEPAGEDAATLSDPTAGSDSAVAKAAAGANPTELSAADTAQTAPVWSRMWRWVPQGMIPIGPRTPDSEKDRGIGIPLVGNGWRSNPFSITAFSGFTDGGPLIPGHLNQTPSFYGGLNLGWDFDHYWGIEKRLGFGALNLTNGEHQPIPSTGLSVTGEYRLMYYPWGDARWRPFLTAGVGWSDFYFSDDHGANHLDTVGMIPFGAGLKYLFNDRFALRVDLIDEMTFGGGVLSNFHYAALTVGLEFRYGHRLINMPWHRN